MAQIPTNLPYRASLPILRYRISILSPLHPKMTRLSLLLLILLFALIFQPKLLEARKVLNNLEKKEVPSFKDNIVGSIRRPKEPTEIVPASKGHAMANNERLFAIHLAKIDRILRYEAVPSPGAGHR
ncbi:hypothetical protein DITRI_Ditri07aG0012500 [Diplodiscus trichospermus]